MQSTDLEELLTNIQKLQSIMIGVATNSQEYRIQDKEEEYKEVYQEIALQIEDLRYEGLSIENPNNFHSLREWYQYCKFKLHKSAFRGSYIHHLYQSLCSQIDIALCKNYINVTSPQALDNELELTQIEELKLKIQKLQEIMIEVANESNTILAIKEHEEIYRKLYHEIDFKITILLEKGISISNPNQFRSLWQWYSFYLEQLESTKIARQEYVNKLYINIIKPVEKTLKEYQSKSNYSIPDLIQYLMRRFNQVNSSVPITVSVPTTAFSNNIIIATRNVDETLQDKTSEQLLNTFSITPTQAVDNSSFATINSTVTWTPESVMNPEIFIEQEDIVKLEDSLENLFTIKLDHATNRRSVFITSGVDDSFIRNINFNGTPVEITNIVVAKFKGYKVSNQRVDSHPMIDLLQYLLNRQESYELKDEDVDLFTKLTERGRENLKAIKARSSVCRIESPKGIGIGTGVVIPKNLLLTCNHIFSKTQVRQAWVRFNYNADSRQLDKDLYELDMNFVSYHNRPDYALVKIKDNFQQQIALHSDKTLDSGQEIRIIHHPQGNPLVISDLGQIMQVGEDYIDHNVKTDHGSSGAPIFNRQWELIAIHQGNVGIGRNFEPGSTGGIPIRAFWNQISSYLN